MIPARTTDSNFRRLNGQSLSIVWLVLSCGARSNVEHDLLMVAGGAAPYDLRPNGGAIATRNDPASGGITGAGGTQTTLVTGATGGARSPLGGTSQGGAVASDGKAFPGEGPGAAV